MEKVDPKTAQVIETYGPDEKVMGRPARMPDPEDLEAGYELSDWDLRGSVQVLVGIVVMAAVAFAVVTGFQWLATGQLGDFAPPEDGIASDVEGPVPDVIQSRALSGLEYRELLSSEQEKLSSYGWISEAEGAVHIPIERAMELMLEQGFPVAEGAEEAPDWNDYGPSDSSSGRFVESED